MSKFIAIMLMFIMLTLSFPSDVHAQENFVIGNVIFIHPDGSALNHWNAGRIYWAGADNFLEWDQLPEIAIYRGHLTDRFTSTSNGGGTTHAFGYKVSGRNSYGQDDGRPILSLSGFNGSIMREAAAQGYPIGIVNDGDLGEPGTGTYLAEVANRDQTQEIVAQLLDGRPGFEDEPLPTVIMGGGERYFLPEETPLCTTSITVNCAIHVDVVEDREPTRDDERNLLSEATVAGYTVIRTRVEFESIMRRLESDETYAPMILGLFATDDIFNAEPEERLLDMGLVDPSMRGTPEGQLLLWGGLPGTLSYNPPTIAEMTDMALIILERRSREVGLPFMLVAEHESNDNFPNEGNSIGMLNAIKRADDAVGVARRFLIEHPNTLLITAADSDAGGAQLFSPPPETDTGLVAQSGGHPTGVDYVDDDGAFPLDGIEGYNTQPFLSMPDAFGEQYPFAIGWTGTNDVAGGIIARAEGLNAELLRSDFNLRFDNTDIYRIHYLTLFGELLPSSSGMQAPSR